MNLLRASIYNQVKAISNMMQANFNIPLPSLSTLGHLPVGLTGVKGVLPKLLPNFVIPPGFQLSSPLLFNGVAISLGRPGLSPQNGLGRRMLQGETACQTSDLDAFLLE